MAAMHIYNNKIQYENTKLKRVGQIKKHSKSCLKYGTRKQLPHGILDATL